MKWALVGLVSHHELLEEEGAKVEAKRQGFRRSDIKTKLYSQREKAMNPVEKLVVIGCGGVGGPASVLAKKLMPEVEVTNIRAEKRFIVR